MRFDIRLFKYNFNSGFIVLTYSCAAIAIWCRLRMSGIVDKLTS